MGFAVGGRRVGAADLVFEEACGVEGPLALEDIVGSACDLLGEDAEGHALGVSALEPSEVLLSGHVVSQEEAGGLGEGPLEMGVSDLAARPGRDFSAGLLLAAHDARVGEEILHAWESLDVVDLVEQDEREDLPDAWDRLQEREAVGVVLLGGPAEIEFQGGNLAIVKVDELEVDLDALACTGIVESLGDSESIGLSIDTAFELTEVVLTARVLDVAEELGAFASEVCSSAEQVSGGAHGWWIDVSGGKVPADEECGDFLRIYAVVLGLRAMDRSHVESMSESELDAGIGAEISEPVPAEDALGPDDDVLSVGSDGLDPSSTVPKGKFLHCKKIRDRQSALALHFGGLGWASCYSPSLYTSAGLTVIATKISNR